MRHHVTRQTQTRAAHSLRLAERPGTVARDLAADSPWAGSDKGGDKTYFISDRQSRQ